MDEPAKNDPMGEVNSDSFTCTVGCEHLLYFVCGSKQSNNTFEGAQLNDERMAQN